MSKNVVLTLTGKDKIGLVEHVTSLVVKRGGNVEASRMAHLGGEFAMLMLISLSDGELGGLDQDLQQLVSHVLKQSPCTRKKVSAIRPFVPIVNPIYRSVTDRKAHV